MDLLNLLVRDTSLITFFDVENGLCVSGAKRLKNFESGFPISKSKRSSQETAQKNEERCFRMFFLRTIDFCRTSRQDLFGRAQKTLSFSLTYFRHENIVFVTFFYAQNGLRDSGVKSLRNFEIAVEDVSVKKRLGRMKSDV